MSAKRVDKIIKSMEFVKNKKIKLIVVGDGELKEDIKKLSEKYTNVDFRGRVSDKELIDFLTKYKSISLQNYYLIKLFLGILL